MPDAPAVRLMSVIFLGFLALWLSIALLQTAHRIVPAIVPPLEERRQPAPFPALSLLFGANGDFAQRLNAWFDDRAGFRDLFIRTKNQIDYSFFRTSRKVYVGANGWLFERSDPNPVARLNPAELSELEASFLQLAERLQEKGIRLIVVGYTDKSQIYPDMAPAQLPLRPPGDNYDKLREFLANQPALTFIDTEAIMRRERTRSAEHLYSMTDMHPTQAGQLPVVKEIIAQIAKLEGRPDIVWDEKFILKHQTVGAGSEGRFLSLLFPQTEADFPYYDGMYTVGGTEPDGTWYLPNPNVLDHDDNGVGRTFDWEFHSRPELCARRLPGMVLFGNSFSDAYWALGLHRYFCFIRRARNPITRFKAFYQTMPAGTKYFIFQYILPWLPGDAPPKLD